MLIKHLKRSDITKDELDSTLVGFGFQKKNHGFIELAKKIFFPKTNLKHPLKGCQMSM